MTTRQSPSDASGGQLSPGLLERVLTKLGFSHPPHVDLDDLNSLYAAVCGRISNDNIQKRIWLVGDRSTPVTGGEPTEFFENWLAHGTGGTCWPINGAMCALLKALGFPARRIASTMMVPWAKRGDANHGTVVVTLDGSEYLVDAQIAAFQVLPLLRDAPSQTNTGIHEMSAMPIEDGFELRFLPGHHREHEFRCLTEPDMDPVDHDFFLSHYDRSANVPGYSPFNRALAICRHFPDSILTIHGGYKIVVGPDSCVTSSEVEDTEIRATLVDEFGVSEEIAAALPPDEPDDPFQVS